MSIKVSARLYASLRKWNSSPRVELRLQESATMRDALSAIGVPEPEIAIVMLNGRRATIDDALSEGDDVQFFPAIGGG